MVGGAKLRLESNPIPTRMLRGLKQTLFAPGPRDPTETETQLCLRVPCGGTGQQGTVQGQELWVQQTWVWHKPSWRKSPLPSPYSHQNLHRTGETDSWRAQTEPCVHEDPGERSSDPTRDGPRLAHECPAVSGRGVGQQWPAAGLGALSVAVHAWDLLREVAVIFITSTIVWPQVNNREGTHLHPSTENWTEDLLITAPPIRKRPRFPLSQSLPSGSFHKPLILLHQRADRLRTTITEN